MFVSHDNPEEARGESSQLRRNDYEWNVHRKRVMEVVSLTLGITALLSFAIFLLCVWLFPRGIGIAFYAGLIAGVFSLLGLIIGLAGLPGAKPRKGLVSCRRAIMSISLGVTVLLLVSFVFMPWLHIRRQEHASRVWGGLVYIERLGKSITGYAKSHDDRLPDANEWADSLMEFDASLSRGDFTHPLLKGPESSFAFNRNLSSKLLANVPKSVVLLFEAEGAWNLAGGQELLEPRESLDVYVCLVSGECYRVNFEGSEYDPASNEIPVKSLRWKP